MCIRDSYITDGSYATVVQSDPGGTEGTTSYERYPNGWVRVKWEGASNNANATTYLQLYIYDHAQANSDGDNIGYAVWGFQVENGPFCTSTILKPTSAAVTRGADNAYMDAIGDSFYNQSEGSVIMEYNYNEGNDGAHSLFSFTGTESDPTASNPRQWLRINKSAGTARAIRLSLIHI